MSSVQERLDLLLFGSPFTSGDDPQVRQSVSPSPIELASLQAQNTQHRRQNLLRRAIPSSRNVTRFSVERLVKLEASRFEKAWNKAKADVLSDIIGAVAVPQEGGHWESQRAGFPALLPYPIEAKQHVSHLFNFLHNKCKDLFNSVLTQNGLHEHHLYFVVRSHPDNEQTIEDNTILVVAPKCPDRLQHEIINKKWFNTIFDIKEILSAMILSPESYDLPVVPTMLVKDVAALRIEFIDERMMKQWHIAPVLQDDPFRRNWILKGNEVVKGILENDKTLNGRWTSMHVFRAKLHTEVSYQRVIYILVNPELQEWEWIPARRSIERFLDRKQTHDIAVHLSRGYSFEAMGPSSFRVSAPKNSRPSHLLNGLPAYSDEVGMGQDYGVGYDHLNPNGDLMRTVGTASGYIKLDIKNPGPSYRHSQTFILTNYHTIRPFLPGFQMKMKGSEVVEADPQPGSLLRSSDVVGFGPKSEQRRQAYGAESPSRFKHDATIARHQSDIDAFRNRLSDSSLDDKTRKQNEEDLALSVAARDAKQTFFDTGRQVVGKPFLASGLLRRSRDGTKVDWALLEVNATRLGKNFVPRRDAWAHWSTFPQCQGETLKSVGSVAGWYDVRPQPHPQQAPRVFMIGAGTGLRVGKCALIRAEVKAGSYIQQLRKEKGYKDTEWETGELSFIVDAADPPERFSDHGDSGGFIFTDDGRWVALHRSGMKSIQHNMRESISMGTDAQSVLDDIRDIICTAGRVKIPLNEVKASLVA